MAKAADTRLSILQNSFELIYTKGYQATSIDDIIATTNLTKGAFYYHFKSKDEMGIAIIKEIVKASMKSTFSESLENSVNPTHDLYAMIKHLLFDNPFLKLEYGCPAGNLTQEMTPWNKEFSNALSDAVKDLQLIIEKSIKKGRTLGLIRNDVNPKQVAYFIMSGYWGIRNFGKLYNSTDCYKSYLKELKFYLKSLE
jgi:TetR/AcrR family transcriptional regulator, transcriptional repressor for nem operon